MRDLSKDPFELMAQRWPSEFVARRSIAEFTGGAIRPGYMANIDSSGAGPPGRFRIGRSIVYPIQSLLGWLKGRTSPVSSKTNFSTKGDSGYGMD